MAGDPPVWQRDDVVAGKYRLVRVLGEGGMGIVYEATHLRLRQRLAIKMLRPALATRYNVVVRFEREARAAAQLRSSHVAKVIDVDATPDGLPYIVMEFLEGSNLAQLLSDMRTLPIQDVVGWVLETCCAIAEAHDLGIVHRDLKPSNLLLAIDGGRSIVKVLDFGISKVSDENDASLTTTQGTLGTPNYMSPEQVRSAKHVDARTDIWSLGVILYELTTGHLPFNGETSTAVAAAIVADPVPPMRPARPDIPPELEATVIRALSKRAEDRFSDVRALARALLPFAKLDAYVTAEVDQMLAGTSRRSPSSAAIQNEPTAAAPTAPGWSQVTASPSGPQKWTLFFAGIAAMIALGWFAQNKWRRADALDPTIASSGPVVTALPSSNPVASSQEAAPLPSSVPPRIETSGAAAPDAGAVTKGPQPILRKQAPKPPKSSAPSVNAPTTPPPVSSSNPLHL